MKYLYLLLFITACNQNATPVNKELSVKSKSINDSIPQVRQVIKMHYDGMIQTDTLKVPNLYRWPVIKVHPGNQKLSCIIGFLDDKENFREYKLLSAEKNHLNLSVLKSYEIVSY